MKNRVLSLFVVLLLLIAVFPFSAAAYVGEIFTEDSGGILITYKVLTEKNGDAPGTVQVGSGSKSAVDSESRAVVIPAAVKGGEYIVTAIGERAISNFPYLRSVSLPDSITVFKDYSFQYCEQLSNINIPASLRSIGEGAFWGCNRLSSFLFPASLTEIKCAALADCNGLEIGRAHV